MNSRRYWKNRIPFLMTNLVCMAVLTVFLLVCGNSISAVLLILVVWALVLEIFHNRVIVTISFS